MNDTAILDQRCHAQWQDAEHQRLPGAYLVQTYPRIRNAAPPIILCVRCAAEWRAWDLKRDEPLIAWLRSL